MDFPLGIDPVLKSEYRNQVTFELHIGFVYPYPICIDNEALAFDRSLVELFSLSMQSWEDLALRPYNLLKNLSSGMLSLLSSPDHSRVTT